MSWTDRALIAVPAATHTSALGRHTRDNPAQAPTRHPTLDHPAHPIRAAAIPAGLRALAAGLAT